MPTQQRPDGEQMFQAYVGMGPSRSYQRVADQFGWSKPCVTRTAMKGEWLKRLREIEAEARHEADKKMMEARVEAHERHIKLAKLIQTRAVQGLQAHQFDNARDASRALVDGVKLERTSLGESNDNHHVSVQAVTRREVESFVTGSLFDDLDNEDVKAEEAERDVDAELDGEDEA